MQDLTVLACGPKYSCQTCQLLTEVVDELSTLLARSQRYRRQALHETRLLRRLLIMDMEERHDNHNQNHDQDEYVN